MRKSQHIKARSEGLGRRIREARRARGLTQERLGERAGVSYKFIGEIERGRGNPTVATLFTLSEALEIDITYLFEPRAGPAGTVLYLLTPTEYDQVQEALESLSTVLKKSGRRRQRRPARKPS